MAANIVKSVNRSAYLNSTLMIRLPRGNQMKAESILRIVAGIGDLTLMPDQQPLRREDLFLFLAKNISLKQSIVAVKIGPWPRKHP